MFRLTNYMTKTLGTHISYKMAEAVFKQEQLALAGQIATIPTAPFREHARMLAADTVDQLVRRLPEDGFDNVVLTGGALDLFDEPLHQRLPTDVIRRVRNPVLGNATGFRIWGGLNGARDSSVLTIASLGQLLRRDPTTVKVGITQAIDLSEETRIAAKQGPRNAHIHMASDDTSESSPDSYFTTSQLVERGWSKAIIAKLLGVPDTCRYPTGMCGGRPAMLHQRARVLANENTDAFRTALAAAAKRRACWSISISRSDICSSTRRGRSRSRCPTSRLRL